MIDAKFFELTPSSKGDILEIGAVADDGSLINWTIDCKYRATWSVPGARSYICGWSDIELQLISEAYDRGEFTPPVVGHD